MAIDKAKIIKDIKAAGFTHLKFELEGTTRRDRSVHSERWCHDFLMKKLEKHGLSQKKLTKTFYGSHTVQSNWFPKGDMTYAEFYYDGSVDSELTFTIKVTAAEKVIHVFEAWQALVDKIGNGIEVTGAGMHITVLRSGKYPTSGRLDPQKLSNFTDEVTKLLPALFIGATSGGFTRALNFRYPRISHNDKYSAIYTRGGTSIEYRLFETCYQRPETYWEFLGVIARTLEYYKNPRKKVESKGEVYEIYDNGPNHLGGYLSFSNQVKIIKRQFKYIKPEGMTAKEFFANRGITLLVKDIKAKEDEKIKKLKLAYQEHKMAHDKVRNEPLNEYQQDNIKYWKLSEPGHTESWYWEKVTGRKGKIEPESTYIKNNMKSNKRALAAVRC